MHGAVDTTADNRSDDAGGATSDRLSCDSANRATDASATDGHHSPPLYKPPESSATTSGCADPLE